MKYRKEEALGGNLSCARVFKSALMTLFSAIFSALGLYKPAGGEKIRGFLMKWIKLISFSSNFIYFPIRVINNRDYILMHRNFKRETPLFSDTYWPAIFLFFLSTRIFYWSYYLHNAWLNHLFISSESARGAAAFYLLILHNQRDLSLS